MQPIDICVLGTGNIIQVRSVDADFSWLSTPEAHTHPLACVICTWSLHYVLSGSEPENNRSSWYTAWQNCDTFASVVWCVCVGSGMRHQAMCDDKAATSILPFNVQQKSNSSLQTTTARYDHHHANTSVRLAWHLNEDPVCMVLQAITFWDS